MKSTLTTFIPLERLEIPPEMRSLAPTEEEQSAEARALEEAKQSLLRSHVTLIDLDAAEADSVVELHVESALPRYNRDRVPVTLGLGLYNPDLETAVTGKAVGETFETSADGARVLCTLLSAKRRSLPESTEGVELDWDADGAADYAGWLKLQGEKTLAQRRDKRIHALLQHITLQLTDRCQPRLDSEELENRTKIYYDMMYHTYTDTFGIPEEQIDAGTKSMLREQSEGTAKWELGDALYAEALGLAPEGEGDEIRQKASAFRTWLKAYCEGLLEEAAQ